MTEPAHNDPGQAELQEQRRRARRAAFLLGALALCLYLGFILATGLRN
ncbi:MAG: hypothetical protein Q8N51_04905 [Gammaproteobacteria bacterium]|nr:hypothetical protein [Gammaproteobacteria bacterium]